MFNIKGILREIHWWLQDIWWRIEEVCGYKPPPAYGFSIEATFGTPPTDERFDEIMDDFIELVESMNLWCGGGINREDLSMCVFGPVCKSEWRKIFTGFCLKQPEVVKVWVSDVRNVEYPEPFLAMEDTLRRRKCQ